jgi:hypothetical protein
MNRRAFRSLSIACAIGASSLAVNILTSSCSSGSKATSFTPDSLEYTGPDGGTAPLEPTVTCSGATGGSVVGPQDNHCQLPDGGQIIQPTTPAGCTSMVAPAGGDDGGGDSGDPCPGDMNAYGAVMYNTWGSDDDCKYDVSWQSTPICKGQPVYFTVIATNRTDGSPLLGVETGGTFVTANPRPDVVLDCTHPIPNTPAPRDPSPEVTPGTYVVGPIVFDESGDWVFRFHFNEECVDIADDSPHGHAAFHIQVP